MASESAQRRQQLWTHLKDRGEPVTGNELAQLLGVSRQVVVQDVALLRAQGYHIIATPRGYWAMSQEGPQRPRRTVAVQHPPTLEAIEQELTAMVDEGASVLDVIVEHPIYGELRGLLMIQSRRDVQAFLTQMRETEAEPLATLTGGVHLHTLEAEREEDLDRVEEVLDRLGFSADPTR